MSDMESIAEKAARPSEAFARFSEVACDSVVKARGNMKKILLTFGFCIGVFVCTGQAFGMNTAAEAFKSGTNAVFAYYRVDGRSLTGEDKEHIMSIERTFKFPMSATPANWDTVKRFIPRLYTEERLVIQELLGDKYGIVSIPNSMYQLFVFNEFWEYEQAHTVFKASFSRLSGKMINERVSTSNKQALMFRYGDSGGYPGYLDASPVQERFWNVNESVLKSVRDINANLASLNVDNLKAASEELVDDLCEKFTEGRIGCDAFSWLFGDGGMGNFQSAFLKDYKSPTMARWSEYARSKILQCVDAETDSMTDPALAGVHSVYREEHLSTSYLSAEIG
jgi:hypothetical protein